MVEGTLASFCQLIFWESQPTVLLKNEIKKTITNERVYSQQLL
jgi:hypothetical protein